MKSRVPTRAQYERLLMLGNGAACVIGAKRDWNPLVQHGWVTARHDLTWLRITPAGLRALAGAVERYGLPELAGRKAAA